MKKLEVVELYLDTKGRRGEFNEFVKELKKNKTAAPEGDEFDKLRAQPKMEYHKYIPNILKAHDKASDGEAMKVADIIKEYKKLALADGVTDASEVTTAGIKSYLNGARAVAAGIVKPKGTKNEYGYVADNDSRTPVLDKQVTPTTGAKAGAVK